MAVVDPRLPVYRGFNPVDTIITVKVGHLESVFSVHRALLCSSSEFFKTKAKPEWTNGGASIDLPHHSHNAFNIYVNWLYTRGIPSTTTASDSDEQHQHEFLHLTEAYVLGEGLMDTCFKDVVIDALRAKARGTSGGAFWSVAMDAVKIIYAGTPEGSKCRVLLVDIFQYHASSEVFANFEEDLPKEFLFEVARALASKRVATTMANLGGSTPAACEYHGHGEGGKCYLPEADKPPATPVKPPKRAKLGSGVYIVGNGYYQP